MTQKSSNRPSGRIFSIHRVQGSPPQPLAVGTTGQCESENMRDASFPLDPESERPSAGFRDGHWVQGSAPAARRAGDSSFVLGVLVQPDPVGFGVLCVRYGQPPGCPVLARLARNPATPARS
jgi:hypothetical protein